MTPKEALELIESVKTTNPDRMVAAANTVALEGPTWAQDAIGRDRAIYQNLKDKIDVQAKRIDEIIAALTGKTPEATAEGAAPSAPSPTVAKMNGGPRRNPRTGVVMTDEQAAAEDEMEAAIQRAKHGGPTPEEAESEVAVGPFSPPIAQPAQPTGAKHAPPTKA